MNREECAKCLTVLRVTYQSFARNMTAGDANAVLNAWEMCFRDDPYELVSMAIYDLIQTKKDFAPDIAAIKERMRDMQSIATGEPSKEELWNILKRAASRSAYNSEEEYAKLPPILQQYVGSPAELHTMSQIDASTFDTVHRGIFFKNIDNMITREEFQRRLSPAAREMLQGFSGGMYISHGEQPQLTPAQVNDRRNEIINALDEVGHM